jgi:hypothetical protein
MIVVSGHGVHLYWRLLEPITNLGRWTAIQKRLIEMFGADKAIHDPARMMRLPGFMNVNGDPSRCYIHDADPGRGDGARVGFPSRASGRSTSKYHSRIGINWASDW